MKNFIPALIMAVACNLTNAEAASLDSGVLTNGTFKFTVKGTIGASTTIETSSQLIPGSWTNIGSIILTNGNAPFTDASASNSQYRFYRAKEGTNCSDNTIGFIKLTLPPGLSLIANQLQTGSNVIRRLFPRPPDGTQFYKYVPGNGWQTYTYDALDSEWLPNENVTLNPGEGGLFRNVTSTNMVLTFIGDVLQGTITNQFSIGLGIYSPSLPLPGTLSSLFPCLVFEDGGQLYKYTTGSGWTTHTYDESVPGWLPSEPIIGIGEAVFIRVTQPKNCIRSFNPCN
jgi:hypothetical protein